MIESLTLSTTPKVAPLPYSYGFDDVALVPDRDTVDPDLCDLSWRLTSKLTFDIPILAAAMDGVVDPTFAGAIHRQGGLGVMNLEGLHGRYADAGPLYERIASATAHESVSLLPELYARPVDESHVRAAVARAKAGGARIAVSATPLNAEKLLTAAMQEGADIAVVQSTVTSVRHQTRRGSGFDIAAFCAHSTIPVIAGNTVAFQPAMELMEAGVAGILVGIGPGAECTSREVLGIGMPQISATLEVSAARDEYVRRTGRCVSVITDGGMRVTSDMVKALAAGADAIMLGAPLAQSEEAPGKGFNWGMASFHDALPRGTRISVGTTASLQRILYGPAQVNNGTQNIAGAIRTAMGVLGARTVGELHSTRIIHAPAIKTEGKAWQLAGKL